MGTAITIWSIRLSLILMAMVIVYRLSRVQRSAHAMRWLWTLGFALLIVHVWAAFEFHHHWSHAHAYQETASKTQEKIGMRFSGGLYFNYVFVALWGIDLLCWWMSPNKPAASWLSWIIAAYLTFIAFNATAVFERGPTRWAGILGAIAIGLAIFGRLIQRKPEGANLQDG